MPEFLGKRWEDGVSHKPESVALLRAINKLDDDGSLDLKIGGDGDIGETLMYYLDEMIDRGLLTLRVQ